MKIILLVLTLTFFSFSARAEMVITNPLSFETAEGQKVGAALMTLQNTSADDDKLIKASAPICGHVELHTMAEENGIMRMREIPKIDVPKGETVALTHDGLHLMLMDLKAPLKAGQVFPLTLVFEKAGEKTVEVKVQSRSALHKMMNNGN